MTIPIIQVQKLRPREGQKIMKLWQVIKVTVRPMVTSFDSPWAL